MDGNVQSVETMSESNQEERWFREAAREAKQARCTRARCGAVIVADGCIIGRGYNAPPQDDMSQVQCEAVYQKESRKPKSDRTCCIHAEWRAMLDALRNHADKVSGSTLYFCRVDESGKMLFSGDPYCTVCSRLALDIGIAFFVLWHENGIRVYDTQEYNAVSYRFHQ